MKKQMGISVDLIVYKHKGQITQEQCDSFIDEFIDLVGKHSWHCGGGAHLMDVNEE